MLFENLGFTSVVGRVPTLLISIGLGSNPSLTPQTKLYKQPNEINIIPIIMKAVLYPHVPANVLPRKTPKSWAIAEINTNMPEMWRFMLSLSYY